MTAWVDESYLKAAIENAGLDYDEVIAAGEAYVITGEDALTSEPIVGERTSIFGSGGYLWQWRR